MTEMLSATRESIELGRISPWAVVWEWIARPVRYRMVRRLRVAAEARDVGRLQELLAPNVAVVIESTEPGAVAPRVVMGRGGAASALVHGLGAHRGRRIVERSVNGQAGLLLSDDGEPSALVGVDFVGQLISVVWVRLHPDLLRHGNRI